MAADRTAELSQQTKVLLLAPTSLPQGGIARWAKLLLDNSTGDKVEYKTIDTSVHYRVLGGKEGFIDRLCGLRDAFLRGLRLVRDILFYRPSIVYFTCSPNLGFAFRDAPLILLSKLLCRKVVIHLRGGDLEGFWDTGYLRKFLANMASKLSDYIFVITRDCEAMARQKFGNNKVVYVANFIDVNAANQADGNIPAEINKDKFNVVHVAFQCKVKGTFEIIEAAKDLPGNVNILLIGVVSEDNRIAIAYAIQKNGIGDKVQLLGAKEKLELWDYYKNADLFLFPTYSEGFPNVIMEAMLFGLPILATDVGNIAEMTDAAGEKPAAILLENAEPPDPVEMAEKIKNLINNIELRQQLSENGIERVNSCYSLKTVIPQLEEILLSISLGKDVIFESKKFFQQNEISN